MLAHHPVNAMIPTQALDQARRFYEDVLGFTPTEVFPTAVRYQCAGGSWFLLYETHVARGAHTVANWTVHDISAEVADLKARGVAFEHYDNVHGAPTEEDSIERSTIGNAAWFTDPDGNVLGLHQPQ